MLGLWALMCGLDIWQVLSEPPFSDAYVPLFLAGYAVAGAVIASRRPGNAVGWLLLAVALAVSLQSIGEAYVATRSHPGYIAVAWVTGWLFSFWIVIIGVFLLLLFPDGRLPSSRWRPVLALGVLTLLASVISTAFAPGGLAVGTSIDNPLGASGDTAVVVKVLGWVSTALLVGLIPLSGASLVLRARRAHGTERQQLTWFVIAGLSMLAGLLLAFTGSVLGRRGDLVGGVGLTVFMATCLFGIPVATGIAILRHHLYDVDVVVNKTLVYGTLSAALVATYACSVVVLQPLLRPLTGGSDLAVAGSTLAVAALARPARARIQAVVDRHFYRRRYDAARILDHFATRLRHEVDLDAVSTDLRQAVEDTVQPAHVSIWLRP